MTVQRYEESSNYDYSYVSLAMPNVSFWGKITNKLDMLKEMYVQDNFTHGQYL